MAGTQNIRKASPELTSVFILIKVKMPASKKVNYDMCACLRV